MPTNDGQHTWSKEWILIEAQNYYNAMYRFRKDRERNKRYNYGDQWGDIVCVNGKKMTEEAYIMSQGNIPLKTNLIRRLVRNVIGVYRSQSIEPTCTARDRYGTAVLEYLKKNDSELYDHIINKYDSDEYKSEACSYLIESHQRERKRQIHERKLHRLGRNR